MQIEQQQQWLSIGAVTVQIYIKVYITTLLNTENVKVLKQQCNILFKQNKSTSP